MPVMSAAVVRHGIMRTRVTKLGRPLSTLYGASVSKGHLLADIVQRGALPPLDALIRHLPAYDSDVHAHASALGVWERACAIADEHHKRAHMSALRRAWRRLTHKAAGLDPPPRQWPFRTRITALSTPPRRTAPRGRVFVRRGPLREELAHGHGLHVRRRPDCYR